MFNFGKSNEENPIFFLIFAIVLIKSRDLCILICFKYCPQLLQDHLSSTSISNQNRLFGDLTKTMKINGMSYACQRFIKIKMSFGRNWNLSCYPGLAIFYINIEEIRFDKFS